MSEVAFNDFWREIDEGVAILSLGAGVNSTALLLWLIDNGKPLDQVIFADTGAEKPETYDYIKRTIEPFLSQKAIPLITVKAKKTLQERCIQGHTIPDRRYRWSTRDFKIRPIERAIRHIFKIRMYIGIAFDEIERVKDRYWKQNVSREYPLVEERLTRQDCEKIILSHGWDLPIKSGCYFCPFMRKSELRWLDEVHPKLYDIGMMIEKNGSKYPNFTIKSGITLETLRKQFANDRKRETHSYESKQVELEECEGFCFT